MNNNILTNLDRLAYGVSDTISPISQSAMLFTKLKQLYFQELRSIKKEEIQTKTSVFTLSLNRSGETLQVQYHTASVIPSSIQNESAITAESIESLIKISNLIDPHTQQELMGQIEDCLLRKIRNLKNPEEILKMFLKVTYMPRYLTKGQGRYIMIEDRIIKELLGISFGTIDPELLIRFIVSLPFRTRSLLPLLSHFIQECNSDSHVQSLYDIFSSLFSPEPTKDQISCLLSISTKQATERISIMVKQQKISSLDMLENEARRKLRRVPIVFNAKGEAIMMFVYFVAIYGGDIWEEIIEWEKTAIQEYKDWFKNNAKSIVNDNHAKDHLQVILLKLTNINYESQISELFFDHVVEMKNKQMFNSVIIKRFLTSKVCYKLEKLKETGEKLVNTKLAAIFDLSLIFVDILLEVFQNEGKSKAFYSYLLESEDENKLLISYLDECFASKKFKFAEFFLKFVSCSRSQILEVNNNTLLHYFINTIDFELAYVLTKQMSLSSPSKFYIVFMKAWFSQKFKAEDEIRALRSTIIRNINIILIRSEIQLNKQFVAHFKQFYAEVNPEEKSKIMTDVPKSRRDFLSV